MEILSGNIRAVVSATKVSPFEMSYGRPSLTLNMLTDPETQAHLQCY